MKIENLTFGYGNNLIFNNFNLQLSGGKITAILGKSGVGKTTLLNVISGLIPSSFKSDKKSSIAFQDDKLIPHLTVKENLKLVGITEKEIETALLEFDVLDKINCYPNKLSGGERQRVNVIRAFLSKRDLILLDEPFSSLDIHLKLKLIKMTNRLQAKNNNTVIFVTHDVEEALLLANRILVLDDGKITLDVTLDDEPLNRNYGDLNEYRQKIITALL